MFVDQTKVLWCVRLTEKAEKKKQHRTHNNNNNNPRSRHCFFLCFECAFFSKLCFCIIFSHLINFLLNGELKLIKLKLNERIFWVCWPCASPKTKRNMYTANRHWAAAVVAVATAAAIAFAWYYPNFTALYTSENEMKCKVWARKLIFRIISITALRLRTHNAQNVRNNTVLNHTSRFILSGMPEADAMQNR